MRKTDKKIDNQLRLVLTDVCETTLKEVNGFQWLTHSINYSNVPKSLKIVCVFDTNDNLSSFMSKDSKQQLTALIQLKLHGINFKIKNIVNHITYDTEENCEKTHDGKWANRLR